MKAVFRRTVGGRSTRPAVPVLRRRLELESLEDRRLPSAGPVLVSSSGQAPVVAIDGAGNFVVAYLTTGQSGSTLTAQRFDVSQTARGTPIQIAVPASPILPRLSLAAAGNTAGDYLLAYPVSQAGAGGLALGLVGQRFSANGATLGTPISLLGPPVPIQNTTPILASISPAVALDASGGFVAAEDGVLTTSAKGVSSMSQESAVLSSAAAGPFASPGLSGSAAAQPALAMDDAGDFVLAWQTAGNVTAEVYNPQGLPISGPIPVADGAATASVAMDPASGAFVVAWSDSNGVFAQLFQSDGAPQGATIPVAVNSLVPGGGTGTDSASFAPVVGMDASGDFTVAYDNAVTPVRGGISGTTATHVLAEQYDVGLPPVAVTVSDPNDPATPGAPALAMNATGSFVVSWDRLGGTPSSSEGVEARLFTSTDVAVTDSDGLAAYVPGRPTVYSIEVTNPGLTAVNGAAVVDNVPAAVSSDTWSTIVSPGASVAAASGSGSIHTTVSLVPGASVTFVMVAQIAPTATGKLVNTTTVTPVSGVSNPGTTSASDLDTPNPLADLAITNTDPTGIYTAGTTISYTVVVTNNGPSAVRAAPVVDDLPPGITSDTWTASASAGASVAAPSGHGNLNTTVNLLPGASVTFTLVAAVDPTTTGNLVTTASVTTPTSVTDPNPFNNSATDSDTPNPMADLAITNSDGITDYTPGTTVNYTIVVRNNGPSAVAGAPVVDNLPPSVDSDTWTATPAAGASVDQANGNGNIAANVDLVPGASVTFRLSAVVDAGASGDLVNTATVNAPASVSDPNLSNNMATVTNPSSVPPPPPPPPLTDFGINKNLVYTQTAQGVSATPTNTFFVSLLDQVPGTFDAGTLTYPGPGSPQSYSLDGLATQFSLLQNFATQADMDAAFPFGTYVGTATEAATGAHASGSIQYTQDAYTSDVPALTPASFNALQGFDPTQPLTLNFNAFTPNPAATPNVNATFLTVFGPPGVVFSDVLSPNATSDTIPANTLQPDTQYTVEIDFSDRIVAGSAPITTQYFDIRTDLAATTLPEADLAVTNTDPAGFYTPGGTITYTVVASNNGPDAVTGAAVTDLLPSAVTSASWSAVASAGANVATPSGTGNIADTVDLQPGATVTFTVTATVDPAATGSLQATAAIQPPAGVIDPQSSNNTAADLDMPGPPPPVLADLAITNTDPLGTYTIFGGINYTIVASNNGPSAVTGATVVDDLPPALSNDFWFSETSQGASVADGSGTSNINTTVDLQPGASVTFFLLAFADDPSTTGDIADTATISPPAGVTDPNPGNNSATDIDTPSPQADLEVHFLNPPGTYTAGTTITYTIEVTNGGPNAVVGAPVASVLPAGITSDTWTAVSAGGGSAADLSGSGNIGTTVDLPSGASVTFTLVGAIDATTTGNLTAQATVMPPAGLADTNPTDETATETDTPNPIYNLLVSDTNGTTLYEPGTSTTYTIVVTNTGPSAVTGASVVDRLPAAVIGDTWSALAWPGASVADPGGSGNIATTVDLVPGATVTFTLSVDIAASATGNLVNTATVTQPPGIIVDPGDNSAVDADAPVPVPPPPPLPIAPAQQSSPSSQPSGALSQIARILSAPANLLLGPPAPFGADIITPAESIPVFEALPSVVFFNPAGGGPGLD